MEFNFQHQHTKELKWNCSIPISLEKFGNSFQMPYTFYYHSPQTNEKHTSRQPKIKQPPLTRLDLTKTTHKLDLLSVCLVLRPTTPNICSFQSCLSHTSLFNGLRVRAANKLNKQNGHQQSDEKKIELSCFYIHLINK